MEIERSTRLRSTDEDDDNYIPDWLLFEVLLRLPLNSVFTCRCVSKQWLSIASAPYFIRAYANSRASSSSQPPPWIVLSSYGINDDGIAPITFEHNPSKHPILLDMYLRPHLLTIQQDISANFLYAVGASHGLVLYRSSTQISDVHRFHFYVSSPITGHHIRPLKPVESPSPIHSVGFLTRVDGEFTLRSYRIVHARQSMERRDSTVIIFNVYYSEIGDWKEFTVPMGEPMEYHLQLQPSAAVVNGILHWADSRRRGVVAYDPEANPGQMRVIRHPKYVEDNEMDACSCMGYRGEELRYFVGHPVRSTVLPAFSIWRLVDYSSGEWCLQHKLEIPYVDIGIDIYRAIRPNTTRLRIALFDPFDSDLVYLIDDYKKVERTFSYNLKSKTLDVQCLMTILNGGSFYLGCPWFMNQVLVVPPWPTRVAEKHLVSVGLILNNTEFSFFK